MTRTSSRISTRYLLIALLASSAPGCTFLSGIEDTKSEKDKARTFGDSGRAGSGATAGSAGAAGQPTVNLDAGSGGASGSDAGAAGADAAGGGGADAGGAAGTEAAGGEGGSS